MDIPFKGLVALCIQPTLFYSRRFYMAELLLYPLVALFAAREQSIPLLPNHGGIETLTVAML